MELIGENAFSFIHETDKKKFYQVFHSEEMNQEKEAFIEYRFKSKTKGWLTMESAVNRIHDGKGNFISVVFYSRDITDRKKTETALKESEELFSLFMDFLPAAAFIKDRQSRSLYINKYMKDNFGAADWIGKTPKEQYPPQIADELLTDDQRAIEQGYIESEKIIKNYKDQKRTYKIHKFKIDKNNEEPLIGGFALDITEEKAAKEKIIQTLEEREILIKEIHHRVKNNLQIISSLLNLQAESLNDEKIWNAFKVTQNRIRSIALIHEKLYQSNDLSRIDFAAYIKELTANLVRSEGPMNIHLSVDIKPIELSMNTAIYCGLIVNELVTNSIKHAFQDAKPGEIQIDLTREKDMYNLFIKDNGSGIKKDIDIKNVSSLGLNLVNNLTKQLNGSLSLDRDKGTCFCISFPDTLG